LVQKESRAQRLALFCDPDEDEDYIPLQYRSHEKQADSAPDLSSPRPRHGYFQRDARDSYVAVPIAPTAPEPRDADNEEDPDDEEDSDDREMTPAELLDCIMNETDMALVDYLGDAREILLGNPQFIVLRQTSTTSLVLFPDGVHGIFLTEDVIAAHVLATTDPLTPRQPWMLDDDDRPDGIADAAWQQATAQLLPSSAPTAFAHMAFAPPASDHNPEFHALALTYCEAALNRPIAYQSSEDGSELPPAYATL